MIEWLDGADGFSALHAMNLVEYIQLLWKAIKKRGWNLQTWLSTCAYSEASIENIFGVMSRVSKKRQYFTIGYLVALTKWADHVPQLQQIKC